MARGWVRERREPLRDHKEFGVAPIDVGYGAAPMTVSSDGTVCVVRDLQGRRSGMLSFPVLDGFIPDSWVRDVPDTRASQLPRNLDDQDHAFTR